jgi:WD40 repeat protein
LASSTQGKILVLKVTPPQGNGSKPTMEWLRSISGFSSQESFYPHAPKPGRMTLTDRVWASEFLATGSPVDFFGSGGNDALWRNFSSIQGGKVGVWDIERGMGRVSQVSGDTLTSLAPHPVMPHLICTAGASTHMYFVDLRTSSLALYSPQALSNFTSISIDSTTSVSQAITSVAWSPFLPWLMAAGGEGGSIGIWDIRYAKKPTGFALGASAARQQLGLNGHVPLESLAPSARSTSAFSTDSTTFGGFHHDSVTGLKWSLVHPNWLVTSSLDKTVRTWKISAEETPLSKGLVSSLARGLSKGTLNRQSLQPTFALVPTNRGRLETDGELEVQPPSEDSFWWNQVRPMRRPDASPVREKGSLSRGKRGASKGSLLPGNDGPSMSILTPSGTGVLPLTLQQMTISNVKALSGFVDIVQSPTHPGLFYAVTLTGELVAQQALNGAAWEELVSDALDAVGDDVSKRISIVALLTRNLAPAYRWVERSAADEADAKLLEMSHSLQPEPPFAMDSWSIGSKGQWTEESLQEAERSCVNDLSWQVLEWESRLPPGYGWSSALSNELPSANEVRKRQWLDNVYLGNVTPQLRSMMGQLTLKTDIVKMSQRNRFDQVKTMGGLVLKNVEAWIRGEVPPSGNVSTSSLGQTTWDADSLSHVIAASILHAAQQVKHDGNAGEMIKKVDGLDASHRLFMSLLGMLSQSPTAAGLIPIQNLTPLIHLLLYPTFVDGDTFAPDDYLEPELPDIGGLTGASKTVVWKLLAMKEWVDQHNGVAGLLAINEDESKLEAREAIRLRPTTDMINREMMLLEAVYRAVKSGSDKLDEEICQLMAQHLPSTPSLVAQGQPPNSQRSLSVATSRLHLDALLSTSRYPEYWRLASDVCRTYPTSDFTLHLVHQMDRHALPMLKAFVDDLYTASSEELADAVSQAQQLSREQLLEKMGDAVGFLRDAVVMLVKIASVVGGISQDASSPASTRESVFSLTPSMSRSGVGEMTSNVATGFFTYLENVLIDLISQTGKSLLKVVETTKTTCGSAQELSRDIEARLKEACIRGNIPLDQSRGPDYRHLLAQGVESITNGLKDASSATF